MTLMKEFDQEYVKVALSVIGGKWKATILWHLNQKTMRFNELNRAIPSITRKILTQQLREMEADGIVHRHVYDVIPPKVEYSLTAYGRTVCPVFQTLNDWGRKHRQYWGQPQENDA